MAIPAPAIDAPPCPRCGAAMHPVARRVPCPCDAPWCFATEKEHRCATCEPDLVRLEEAPVR